MDISLHYGTEKPYISLKRIRLCLLAPKYSLSHWLSTGPRARKSAVGQACVRRRLDGNAPWTSPPQPGQPAPPTTYHSCSVPAALFSESGTGSGWESRLPGGTLVRPAQRQGGMKNMLTVLLEKTLYIKITDVKHKWVAGLHLDQGSKYRTTDLIDEARLNSK